MLGSIKNIVYICIGNMQCNNGIGIGQNVQYQNEIKMKSTWKVHNPRVIILLMCVITSLDKVRRE